MGSYVKIWTDLLYDPWFLGLTLIEKGMWFMLIVLAKQHGDTGQVSFASWRGMGSACGCDGKSCKKFLTSFRSQNKIVLNENHNGTVLIEIINYEHYQRVKTVKDRKKEVVSKPIGAEKSHEHRHYKIREDNIREDNINNIPAKPDSSKPTDRSIKKDPTHGYICKAIVDEIKSKLGTDCPYPLAGKIIQLAGWKAGEGYPWGLYGHIMVCIGRVSTWINENHFIGAITKDLKCRHGKIDGSFAWPEADLTLIKAFENKFENWMKREFPQKMDFKIGEK